MVDAMTSRMLSVVAAAIIAGLVVYDPPTTEIRPIPEPIDFTHLNSQAAAALQLLKASQAQRIAPQVDDDASVSSR
jgi:hypothetical protein